MVGPGALKPKVGDGIKSRRPFSAPVLHSFILLFFFFVLCLLLHLYWCVYNNNNNNNNNNATPWLTFIELHCCVKS